MNIVMLLASQFPPDIRVEKELESLIKANHQVHILCHQSDHLPTHETFKGAQIYRYVAYPFFKKLYRKIIFLFTFINPIFLLELEKLSQKIPIDVIHVHDLPLSKTALVYKKRHPYTKVILDLHENYPEALSVWSKWNKGLKAKIQSWIFERYSSWLRYEGNMIKSADHVIAVVDEMKTRLINAHQIPSSQISVVSNTEPQSFAQMHIEATISEKYQDHFIISYIGGIGPHRGIDTAILGMTHLINSSIKLLIIGDGRPVVMETLDRLIKQNNLADQVELLGWKPFEQVSSYITSSDICLIPHHSNPHTDNGIPHKLFQYMAIGKPLLVSSSAPLKRVVEAVNSGKVFEAGNPQDFAKKILWMKQNPEFCKAAGENGIVATSTGKYRWEEDAKVLCGIYDRIRGQQS